MNTPASFFCTGTMPAAARLPSSGSDQRRRRRSRRSMSILKTRLLPTTPSGDRGTPDRARRIVDADAAVVALEHEELRGR